MATASNENFRADHNSGYAKVRSETVRKREGTYVKLFWLGVVLECGVAGLAMLAFMYERGQRARLAARMTKLSAEGAPVDDSSLARIYHARTSVEMLDQWSKVFALAKKVEDANAGGDKKEAELRLAALRQEVAVAVKADQPCRFIEKFEATYTLLPHLGELRSTARLLASHAKRQSAMAKLIWRCRTAS